MTTPVITFFNSTRGVGATSFVYHLAWMYVELRLRVVVVDLDHQATLTATFLDEDQITEIFDDTTHTRPTKSFFCLPKRYKTERG
jgi:cellulose biosynthesis protein BcsQ